MNEYSAASQAISHVNVELAPDVSQTDSISITKALCDEGHFHMPEALGLKVQEVYCVLCEYSRVYIGQIGSAIDIWKSTE